MSSDIRHSALYEGWLSHQRYLPTGHAFRYRLFQFYLDLDEIPAVLSHLSRSPLRAPFIRFSRKDYLAPGEPDLKKSVLDLVETQTGHRPHGPVRLLANLRCLGFVFNPVSFYYCFGSASLEAIVAEITNTPWNERHAYVLDCRRQGDANHFVFGKTFHVSPFMPMNMVYRWEFNVPEAKLRVRMDNICQGERHFQALLDMEARPFENGVMRRMFWRYPLMTQKIAAAIYFQAGRLWLKGMPFFTHPKKIKDYRTEVDHDPGKP